MIEQGTWPSQEWRLPPKQQDRGSNPRVPAIMIHFPVFQQVWGANCLIGEEFYAFDSFPVFGLSNAHRRQTEYLYIVHFASSHVRTGQ